MSILRFDGVDDLVEKANNTVYGLAAAVVTRDIDKALYVANNIRAGTVWSVSYRIYLFCINPSALFFHPLPISKSSRQVFISIRNIFNIIEKKAAKHDAKKALLNAKCMF